MNKKKYLPMLVLVVILAIGLGIGIGALIDRKDSKPQASTTATPEITQKYEITCTSYDTYTEENVDFNFIIAKLHIKTNQQEIITLDHFTTSEGIVLSEVDSYKEQLQAQNFDFETKQIVTELSNEKNEYDANIFIPTKAKDTTKVTLSCDLDGVKDIEFVFDMETPTPSIEPSEEPTPTPTVDPDGPYEIILSSSFEITGELLYGPNELEYSLPSTARVFALPISVISNDGNAYTIDSATFQEDTYGLVNALNGTVHSSKYANMLNVQVTDSNEGYLFFVLLDSEHTNAQYHGIFTIHLAGADYTYTLETNLG